MNAKIAKLNTKLATLHASVAKAKAPILTKIDKLTAVLQSEYDRTLAKDRNLAKDLAALESSTKYGADECGIYRWARLSSYELPAEEHREFLETYLDTHHGVRIDFENEALQSYQGGVIVINEDGDVYSADDGANADAWIVNRTDYETTEERNAKIEAWMHSKGYFPGVFTMDRHGNVFLVNTAPPKGAKNEEK